MRERRAASRSATTCRPSPADRQPPPPARVLILQEYVPDYRDAFFRRLRTELELSNIHLTVAAGHPGPGATPRGDATTAQKDLHVRQLELAVLGKRLTLRALPLQLIETADLVIVEQARRNLDVYALLLGRRWRHKVALHGHGSDTVSQAGPLRQAVLRHLTLRAGWFFAYTAEGRQAVVDMGYPRARTTVVNNTIDTTTLGQLVERTRWHRIEDSYDLLGIAHHAPALSFIGALDSSKNVELLLNAWQVAVAGNPRAQLVIAGDGPLRDLVQTAACTTPGITYVGRADAEVKAAIAATCTGIVVPGRVGLVAVDALTMNLPLLTCTGAIHAPEFAYLVTGKDVIEVDPDAETLAQAMLDLLDLPVGAAKPPEPERQAPQSTEAMAYTFAQGIRRFLGHPPVWDGLPSVPSPRQGSSWSTSTRHLAEQLEVGVGHGADVEDPRPTPA